MKIVVSNRRRDRQRPGDQGAAADRQQGGALLAGNGSRLGMTIGATKNTRFLSIGF